MKIIILIGMIGILNYMKISLVIQKENYVKRENEIIRERATIIK
jgi:hypothetical protein